MIFDRKKLRRDSMRLRHWREGRRSRNQFKLAWISYARFLVNKVAMQSLDALPPWIEDPTVVYSA
jgi:hypothetical protein